MEKKVSLRPALFLGENVLFLFDWLKEYPDYYLVTKDNKYAVISKDGTIILKPEWDYICICGNAFLVKKDCKYGLYTKDGAVILNAEWDDIYIMNDCFFVVKDSQKYVFDVNGSPLE